MSEFNINNYFANRQRDKNKLQSLIDASNRKQEELLTKSVIPEAPDPNAWLAKLGFQPDTVMGDSVNAAASLASGATRTAGDIVTAPLTSASTNNLNYLDEEVMSKYQRYKDGTATPEDIEYLNAPIQGGVSALERINAQPKMQENLAGIRDTFDTSSIVDQTQRNRLNEKLAQNFEPSWDKVKNGDAGDKVAGIAELIFNGGKALLSEPGAVFEYTVENAPQLLLGAAGAGGRAAQVVSNIGYAADAYNQGLDNYAKENNGALPPVEERRRMAIQAAGIAASEQLGDVVGLGTAGLLGRTGKAVKEGAEETARRLTLKKALGNTTGATLKEGATEATTEGVQTYLEGEVTGKPASALDIYTGAAIGGAAGASLSGGIRGLSETNDWLKQPRAPKKEKPVKGSKASVSKLAEQARETGDVTELTKADSKNYAPDRAIASLAGYAVKNPDKVKDSLSKAEEILEGISERESTLQNASMTPEARQNRINRLESDMAKMDKADPSYKAYESLLASDKKAMENGGEPDPAHKRSLEQLKQLREAAERNYEHLVELDKKEKTSATVGELVQKVKKPEQEGDTNTAVEKIISMAMASPDSVDPVVIEKLANDKSNNLRDDQRMALRALSKSRVASNQLKGFKDVSREIYEGSPENLGIRQYQQRMARALDRGDTAGAERNLRMISTFMQGHKRKAAVAAEALAMGKGNQIIYADGDWRVNDGEQLSPEALTRNGGLNIDSNRLPDIIQREADAITAAYEQMRAAYDSQAINKPTKTSKPKTNNEEVSKNVPNLAQQRKREEPKPEAVKAQGDGRTSGRTNDAGSTGTKGKQTQGNQTTKSDSQPDTVVENKPEAQEKAPVKETPVEAVAAPGATKEATKKVAESAKDSIEKRPTKETNKTDEVKEVQTSKDKEQQEASVQEVPVETKTETEEETTTEDSRPGLSVLKAGREFNKAFVGQKLGAIYQKMNRAAAWITQKHVPYETDADIAKQAPLVEIAGFLTQWSNGVVSPQDFFTHELDWEEAYALASFKDAATKWKEDITKSFIKGSLPGKTGTTLKPENAHWDPAQDLVHKDGSVDENLVTAVAYAAFSWFVQSAGTKRQVDKAIMNMLGMPPLAWIRSHREELNKMSATSNQAAVSMGEHVVRSLGIQVSKDAPTDYQARLVVALGEHALDVLERQGLVETVAISENDLAKAVKGFKASEPKKDKNGKLHYKSRHFIRVIRNPDLSIKSYDGATFADSQKGAGGILMRFMETRKSAKYATTTPVKFTQTKAKRTNQDVPKLLSEVLNKAQQVPHTVIPAMWNAMQAVGDSVVLQAAGYQDLETTRIHIDDRESALARNEALERELENAKLLVNKHPEGTEFFPQHSVWKNFRVGQTTVDMNTQGSKIQRAMFQRPEWKSTFKLNDAKSLFTYEIGLAQAFGLKVDAKPFVEVQKDFIAMIEDPSNRIAELAEALHKASQDPENNSLTEEQKVAIGELSAGREGMQTFQALVSLGQYLDAITTDKESFETTLLVGADGKTNGPILSILSLAAGFNVEDVMDYVNRGGFYRAEDATNNFNDWYTRGGSQDLYQMLGKSFLRRVNTNSRRMRAVQVILKDLLDKHAKITSAGRNVSKTPLTSFMFGSSVSTSINNMAEAFLESYRARIADLASGKEKSITREELIQGANYLIVDPELKIDINTPIEELLDSKLSGKFEANLMYGFTQALSRAVKEAMETDFAAYIHRRSAITGVGNLAFNVYASMYEKLYQEELQRLVKEGEIGVGKTGEPLHGLTANQEQALRDRLGSILPVAHTAYSRAEGNLSSGVFMGKKDRMSGDMSYHKVTAYMGQKFDTPDATNATVRRGTAMIDVESEPGAAVLPYAMHSLDSYAMHLSIRDTESQNNHDEGANAAHLIERTAQRLNEATWDALLNYSPMREVVEMFERILVATAKQEQTGLLDPDVKKILLKNFSRQVTGNKNAIQTFEEAVTLMRENLFEVEQLRLETMSELTSIDQYTWEGGEYQVTEEDRKEAKKQLAAHLSKGSAPPAEVLAAAKLIDSVQAPPASEQQTDRSGRASDGGVQPPKAVALIDIFENVDEGDGVDVDTKSNTSVFGKLGPSSITSDPGLVSFFEKNPKRTAKQVINGLMRGHENNPELVNSKFNRQLLKVASKLIDPDLQIVYITPESKNTDVVGEPKRNARGWYSTNQAGTQGEIYVLSPEFENSGLTPELLIHELVHAAITRTLNSKAMKHRPYIRELYALLNTARGYVHTHKAQLQQEGDVFFSNLKSALTNLDEFVAWGMSNADFQTKVLAKISMESKTVTETTGKTRSKLVKGMSVFITNLARLLGFQTLEDSNGLGVFLANTSWLLQSASTTKPTTAFSQKIRDADSKQKNKDIRNLAMATPHVDAVQDYGTLDIFAALGKGSITDSFNKQLHDLLTGIVDRLHGPLGSLKQAARATEAGNPLAVWMKAMETGKAPFAAKILASPMVSSAQEDFVGEQVEATVRAALNGEDATASLTYRELSKLYMEAYKKLSPESFHPGNWANATPNEKDIAQQKYDFVFKMERTPEGKADYLSRFAAMGLANQEFNELLKFNTAKVATVDADSSLITKLKNLFKQILQRFSNLQTKTFDGQAANTKLATLVETLVDIEAKKRHALSQAAGRKDLMGYAESQTAKAAGVFKDAVVSVAGSGLVRNASLATVRATGSLARLAAGDKVDALLDQISAWRDQLQGERVGLLGSLVNEIRHPKEIFQVMLRATKRSEQLRQDNIGLVTKMVLDGFDNQGKNLTDKEKAAISSVFLRTGAHLLTKDFSMSELSKLLSDPLFLEQAISDYEAKLLGQYAGFQITQAKALAYFKVTGHNRSKVLMMNAHNIVNMFGTPVNGSISEDEVLTNLPHMNALVALYALQYSDSNKVIAARRILDKENARGSANGVEFLLALRNRLEEDSKERLFDGHPALMQHGFTPEIYNHNTKVVTANLVEGKELLNQGYVEAGNVLHDPADPMKEKKRVYLLKDGGLNAYQSGAILLSSVAAKGSEQHNGWLNPKSEAGEANAKTNADILKKRAVNVNVSKSHAKAFDPRNMFVSYMAPVVNENGNIVNWRYLMNENTKDTLLDRQNNFEHVMGSLAGSILHKPMVKEQNATIIKSLYEQYKQDFNNNPDRYVDVGPESTDPKIRELWGLLSEDTRNEVKNVWGVPKLTVPKEAMDIIFGNRKLSFADTFHKVNQERILNARQGLPTDLSHITSVQGWRKQVVAVVENVVAAHGQFVNGLSADEAQKQAAKAAHIISKNERIWKEIVAEAKDIIVVKSGIVLLGNILANVWLLGIQGVPIKDIIKQHTVALQATKTYRQDSSELARLEALFRTGYVQGNEEQIQREIIRLRDAIERNPVTKLIDAGLMPTIVDDVSMVDDPYSYKSALSKKVDKWTGKLPEGGRTALRNVYMTHDTQAYKFLSKATQLSDFVARYTLYEHLISRKNDPLTPQQAVQRASDSFVNYDIPMHPILQYSDDMGLTYFTKYFLRIQKELLRVMKENPARMAMVAALGNVVDLGPTVLDSHWINHIGNNPLDQGAFKYVTSLDDLATVSTAAALIK